MRPQRVRLEDEPEVAAFGRDFEPGLAVEHDGVPDPDAAVMRNFEARHGTQQGRFAASRRTEQRHDLAAAELERDALQDRVVAIGQMQIFDGKHGHDDVLA